MREKSAKGDKSNDKMSRAKRKAEVKKVKCKHCGVFFTLLLAHLKKKADCQKVYGEEYYRMLDSKLQDRRAYKSNHKQLHCKENKEAISQSNKEYFTKNR